MHKVPVMCWPSLVQRCASALALLPGSVRFWKGDGGNGFIIPEEPGDDVCARRHALQNATQLEMHDHVQYHLAWNGRKQKYQAASVARLPQLHSPAPSS